MANCSCGNSKSFKECCEPLLKGELEAANPETLMRSRYSAFVHRDIDYLHDTLDPQARYDFDEEATRNWAEKAEFTGLEIISTSAEGNKGHVEFKAHYKMTDPADGSVKEFIHHEHSKFRKQGGVWYFRDGKLIEPKPKN